MSLSSARRPPLRGGSPPAPRLRSLHYAAAAPAAPFRARSALFQLFQPDVLGKELPGALNLQADLATRTEHLRVFVDQDRNDASVEEMRHGIADRDDVKLVPVVRF